jgi:two-component system response regulator CpxR
MRFPDTVPARVPRARVLLIEDDRELADLTAQYLEQHEYAVEVAHDGHVGLSRAFLNGHDVVILDLMLPHLPGMEVLRQLRRRSAIPVIVLTAKVMLADRIDGLQAGADDYLCKPFAPAELLARIDAVLRRARISSGSVPALLEVHGIQVHYGSRTVEREGQRIEVTSTEFDLLDLLMRSAGRVLSRNEICLALFQREASPFERSLEVHVCHLRKKLEHPGETLIRSVRGVGYLFSAETRG